MGPIGGMRSENKGRECQDIARKKEVQDVVRDEKETCALHKGRSHVMMVVAILQNHFARPPIARSSRVHPAHQNGTHTL